MNYIKKHWKKILCITTVIAIFPFVLERFLFATPIVSEFSNEIWFSFIGSYIGSVVTLVVMFVSFKKSDEENKQLLRRQKWQHDIEVQNEKLLKIIHILLLDNYHFLNADTVYENIVKFGKDLRYVQFDTLKYKYVTLKDQMLIDELLRLQMEEVEVLKNIKNAPHVDSEQAAKRLKMFALEMGFRLSEIAESRKNTIKAMYDSYLEKVYEEYYE